MRALVIGLCLIAVGACGDQPDPTYLVVKSRIIGATYTVVGAPERASARPGESVRVELMVTQPAEPTMNTWAIILCRPAATVFGIGFCDGDPLGAFIGATPTEEPPSFVADVPAGPAEDLLFIGAVCMGGQVNLAIDMNAADEVTNPCMDEGVGQLVTGNIFVRDEGSDENLSPRIGEVRFGGEVWPSSVPSSLDDCEAESIPQIFVDGAIEHTIQVGAVDGSRESFIDRSFDPPQETKEDLPVAFYATEFGVSNLYSVIDADAGDEAFEATAFAEITYVPEGISVPASGRVVYFDIVMRDDRGGMDRTRRALCLRPTL